MATDDWYYAKNNQQAGPVTWEALYAMTSSGQLAPTDICWREGDADWVPLAEYPQLFPQPIAPTPLAYRTAPATNFAYAGFWLRFCALVIDVIVIMIPIVAITVVMSLIIAARHNAASRTAMAPSPDDTILVLVLYLLFLLVVWLYWSIMESSSLQGTLGKMLLGLRVTDLEGNRISFGRASGRLFAKYLSGILYIGYIMAAFTEKKQGLHDMIASTLVVRKG